MRRGKGGGRGGGGGGTKKGLLPSSLRIISSCLKTVSSNAGSVASTVRSAGASVAASIASPVEDEKDQVLWAGFDKLELGSSHFKHVLLLGYSNGFQVLDVEDASNVHELVSKRDGPVTFLQMQPLPAQRGGTEGFISSHPMLSVVAGDESNGSGIVQGGRLSALIQDSGHESSPATCISTPTIVRFFSLKSNSYVHVLRFRSAVYVVRCSPQVVAVALAAQIYCFDAVTLENKFSVLTYPMPGAVGVNVGYGPLALGSRWLAYASNNPLLSNTGRLSPQNLTPSPGVSPSTSPGNGSLVARYAMESSKQLAAGIMNLGDMGYKTLSKYCQDLLPDGSNSPVSSNSGRKVGIVVSPSHSSEADNAGMVVVKDFVSREVISQFRAHTSPISALCFDPSGTLLVTASVHGNNINVFRIMPTPIPNGSNSSRYDWSSSHVHLYKLYRGLTTAVIQDISFSHYSQWISVVSSRGTCHIYVLSPFGGDACLQAQNCDPDGPVLVPTLSLPWWSTASWVVMDHQGITPPLPMTLSVVSRIKNGTSGWLNTVSNVAASAAGKVHVPSGAIAAVFHNSVVYTAKETRPKGNSLEHLLVYSPSGHVIQHELLPSAVPESPDSSGRISSGPLLPAQDDELRVNAEPVQWWDVWRRKNWPERDECISNIVLNKPVELIFDPSDCDENPKNSSPSSPSEKNSVKMNGRSCWYLSNAEVRGLSVRIPVWQKSKISFFIMSPSKDNWGSTVVCSGGEVEIEKISTLEVEVRQKDLLPVFQHGAHLDLPDRTHSGNRHLMMSPRKLVSEHSKAFSEERQVVGLLKMQGSADDMGEMNPLRPCSSIHPRGVPCHHDSIQSSNLFGCASGLREDGGNSVSTSSNAKSNTKMLSKNFENDCCELSALSLSGLSCAVAPVDKTVISKNGADDEIPTILDAKDSLVIADAIISHDKHELAPYLQEGYCKLSELGDRHESAETVTDADSNSSSSCCEKVKNEDDGDNDEMLGGIFAFSEEG